MTITQELNHRMARLRDDTARARRLFQSGHDGPRLQAMIEALEARAKLIGATADVVRAAVAVIEHGVTAVGIVQAIARVSAELGHEPDGAALCKSRAAATDDPDDLAAGLMDMAWWAFAEEDRLISALKKGQRHGNGRNSQRGG